VFRLCSAPEHRAVLQIEISKVTIQKNIIWILRKCLLLLFNSRYLTIGLPKFRICQTIILLLVLYTVKRGVLSKNNLKFHGNRQLKKTFGPNNDEVTVKDVIHQKFSDLYRSAIRLLIGHLISYLFHDLFNDAVSSSDCAVSNDRMTLFFCLLICSLLNDVFSKADYIASND
jgi:hypothetical protein